MKKIGQIAATEKQPTTIDEFYFWTRSDCILNPFDVVKVEHIDDTVTFGVIEEINHITDSPSYLGNFISSDFGDTEATSPTDRLNMNYVKAKVVGNTRKNSKKGEHNPIYIPVRNGSTVSLASSDEVSEALGLKDVQNPIPCGYLKMYTHEKSPLSLPVNINSKFLIGPEGAHLNISGISGLAAKTSYSMFLFKAIQEYSLKQEDENGEGTAFIVMNVKGKDLLYLDQPNKELDDNSRKIYEELGLSSKPFDKDHIKYLFPHSARFFSNSYLTKEEINGRVKANMASIFCYSYGEDIGNIDLLLANMDDPNGTLEAICDTITSKGSEFGSIDSWEELKSKVKEFSKTTKDKEDKRITALSWRRFERLITKPLKNPIFDDQHSNSFEGKTRLRKELAQIGKNDMYVIDVANLDETLQSFVFGDVIRTIYDLKLGQLDESEEVDSERVPKRIILFIDELNKYASSDIPRNSPILRQILDISERGRSLGIVLFGAEQFRSAIHDRVKGNCATHAYGRTNAIEISKGDYRYIPNTYKNMMTRLEPGEYIIENPLFRSPLSIRFPLPVYHQEK